VLLDDAGLKDNPVEKVREKDLKTNTRRELILAELKEILEAASGNLQALLYLGTFTGLRLGDCCTLNGQQQARVPLPPWARELAEELTAKNQKQIKEGLLNEG